MVNMILDTDRRTQDIIYTRERKIINDKTIDG